MNEFEKFWNESNKFFWKLENVKGNSKNCCAQKFISFLGSNLRQLLFLSHSAMLVETANIFNNFDFKWPAGLHLWSNSKGSSSSSSTTATITTTTSWTTVFLSTSWSIGLLVPASLVLCWRNMTTEYSSPYKVGLIDVGTKFAQSWLTWSAIAYGKLNFRGTVVLLEKFVANATLAPHQSAQVIIQCGTRYVDFFSLLGD